MNSDIRLSVEFFQHHKTRKLMRRMGHEGVTAMLCLWCYAGKHRPSGVLQGMDAEDIAMAAEWAGEPDELVSTLCTLGWLEQCEEGIYEIHDWEEHNSYAAEAEDRSGEARLNSLLRHYPEAKEEVKRRGLKSLDREQFDEFKKYAKSLRRGYQPHAARNADSMPTACDTHAARNALSLSPSPEPEEENTPPIPPPLPSEAVPDDEPQGGRVGFGIQSDPEVDLPIEGDVTFLEFAEQYPGEVDAARAGAVWRALFKTRACSLDEIYDGLDRWKACERWQRGYVPKLSNWLQDKRFRDEPPQSARDAPDMDMLKQQARKYHGTDGDIGLRSWLETLEIDDEKKQELCECCGTSLKSLRKTASSTP